MAVPPVFVSGQVLTAAEMNAVGLWLIKTQSIGSGVASVTVSDVFSADYDAYKIIISNGVGSTNADLNMTLGSTATGYSFVIINMGYGSATVSGASTENTTSWGNGIGRMSTENVSLVCDIINPYLARRTEVYANAQSAVASGTAKMSYIGLLGNTTSYTAFTLTTGTGTLTSGTIRVYGYRN